MTFWSCHGTIIANVSLCLYWNLRLNILSSYIISIVEIIGLENSNNDPII